LIYVERAKTTDDLHYEQPEDIFQWGLEKSSTKTVSCGGGS